MAASFLRRNGRVRRRRKSHGRIRRVHYRSVVDLIVDGPVGMVGICFSSGADYDKYDKKGHLMAPSPGNFKRNFTG